MTELNSNKSHGLGGINILLKLILEASPQEGIFLDDRKKHHVAKVKI